MSSAPAPVSGPAKLGKYDLLRRIGIGGMGEVFLARERGVAGFDRLVVVKRLIPHLAENPEMIVMFVDEARVTAHLRHPNIVQIYDFGNDGTEYFIAMEYVPGRDLSAIVGALARKKSAGLSLRQTVHVIAEIASALEFVHAARDADGKPLNLVHRDVTPHNILVSRTGELKLMDFGIAKSSNRVMRTQTGMLRGKLAYMAPEQARGEAVAASDVFAAGIILWELGVNRRLFRAGSDVEMLHNLSHYEIPSPSALVPSFPAALEQLVMAALDRDPKSRPTAAEFASGLRGVLLQLGGPVERKELGAIVTELFPEQPEGNSTSASPSALAAAARPIAGRTATASNARMIGLVTLTAALLAATAWLGQRHFASASVPAAVPVAVDSPSPSPSPAAPQPKGEEDPATMQPVGEESPPTTAAIEHRVPEKTLRSSKKLKRKIVPRVEPLGSPAPSPEPKPRKEGLFNDL